MTKRKRDRAAQVLLDAAVMGEKKAAEKHKLSRRSVQRYQSEAERDPELARIVAENKAALNRSIQEKLAEAMSAQLDFMLEAARKADPSNPDAIYSISGSFKILSEVSSEMRFIDAKIARQAAAARAATGQTVAGSAAPTADTAPSGSLGAAPPAVH